MGLTLILGLVGLFFGLEGFLDFLEKVTREKEENKKKITSS